MFFPQALANIHKHHSTMQHKHIKTLTNYDTDTDRAICSDTFREIKGVATNCQMHVFDLIAPENEKRTWYNLKEKDIGYLKKKI